MKIAFLFSGQGAQYAGMAEDLYQAYPEMKRAIDEAGDLLGEDMTQLLFTENERLHWTPLTQPSILAMGYGLDQIMRSKGIEPQASAGLSLGEYTALVSAGALDYADAIQLVHRRGQFMDEAVPQGQGAMAAILGLENDQVEAVCQRVSDQGDYVIVANYNQPGQVSIAGLKDGVEKASQALEEAGAKRVVPLQVSGPFHTALLEPASQALAKELEGVHISKPKIPVYGNTEARQFVDEADIKEMLVQQVKSPVRFEQMIQQMVADGFDTFVELGPGKTLTRFVKAIDKSVSAYNVESLKSLDRSLKKLSEEG